MLSRDYYAAVRRVRLQLRRPKVKAEHAILIVMCGLPGTGKSTLADRIADDLPAVVLQSDFVRKTLFARPTYSASESRFVHDVTRTLTAYFLRQGHAVINDATNLVPRHRQLLVRVAERVGVPHLLVYTTAPEALVRSRLRKRLLRRPVHDLSDADWHVYEAMAENLTPVREPHLRVDTSGDVSQIVKRILRAAKLQARTYKSSPQAVS